MQNIFKHPYVGPWEFQDTPDGKTNTIIQQEGCPIITVRGSDDMSCIEEEEVDEVGRINSEQVALANMVLQAPELTRHV